MSGAPTQSDAGMEAAQFNLSSFTRELFMSLHFLLQAAITLIKPTFLKSGLWLD